MSGWIDESTVLCLACSSSIHPSIIKRYKQGSLHPARDEVIFFTNCCKRPICPSCIVANARLKQYDPCLHCLKGVGAIISGTGPSLNASIPTDQDMFILGDDEDDEDGLPQEVAPLSYEAPMQVAEQPDSIVKREPFQYHLTPKDTLQGIAIRYGVNGYEICRLNKLPPSTLTTTPQLLHTRAYILLPPGWDGQYEMPGRCRE